MYERTSAPPPGVLPIATFANVEVIVRDPLLAIDNLQAHTGPTQFLIATHVQNLSAQSTVEAHMMQWDAVVVSQLGAQ